MVIAARLMIRAHHEQAGVFTLRAGVRLERHGREAGDLRQLILELAEEELVSGRLVAGRKWMKPVELAPADRHHLGGGVQLHRAGAERDHRGGQRQVA